ncbi:ER lumen protein retaining receptor [Tritrichomonas foetus]|uniref:ER lumen protein-retaining receptor n=1 Tax=Tritrichomonas foetus TaxID=1144522 RepID=A0A1J4J9A4_9EUKA|nr:ER lumen protein retaining receptor [Tritrichomonas foetus]|eukprot:OHS95770.1 ER lumen protein retaining receptor [Tritrichomonas foetus]
MRIVGANWNIFRYMADFSHLISILLLLFKMIHQKSCSGISLKTQIIYFIVFVCRYYDGILYPPLYNIFFKFFYIITSMLFIILMKTKLRKKYNAKHDSFNIYIILVVCFPIAFFTSKTRDIDEILWTYSLWLESVAILPQLFLLRRTQRIDLLSTDYIFFLGMYRLFYICNWVKKAFDKNRTYPIVWTTGIIQTLVYLDFLYYYIIAKVHGNKFTLPR